jgi:hypothetical protein
VISWNTIRRTGTFGFRHLDEMPRDRLALAILVRREQQLVGFESSFLRADTTFFLPGSTT